MDWVLVTYGDYGFTVDGFDTELEAYRAMEDVMLGNWERENASDRPEPLPLEATVQDYRKLYDSWLEGAFDDSVQFYVAYVGKNTDAYDEPTEVV